MIISQYLKNLLDRGSIIHRRAFSAAFLASVVSVRCSSGFSTVFTTAGGTFLAIAPTRRGSTPCQLMAARSAARSKELPWLDD